MKKYKIAWQKYEDYIEKQMSSPILDVLTEMMMEKTQMITDSEQEEEYYEESDSEKIHPTPISMVPISQQLIEDISMLSSFDCWIGHTNFNITQDIKNRLDQTEGVEILKIMSRYRFFIGLGRLFDFKEVRKNIEKIITPEY